MDQTISGSAQYWSDWTQAIQVDNPTIPWTAGDSPALVVAKAKRNVTYPGGKLGDT